MAKKSNTKKVSSKSNISKINNNGNEIVNLLKIIIVLCIILLIFYIITTFVNKKEETAPIEEVKTPVEIQYATILVGNLLTQNNKTYYVLAKKQDDNYAQVYEAYLKVYSGTKDSNKVYYIDLDNPLNSNFLNEESNFKIKNIEDIKFKETTLLLIQNGKIKSTYEGKEKITEMLQELTKEDE